MQLVKNTSAFFQVFAAEKVAELAGIWQPDFMLHAAPLIKKMLDAIQPAQNDVADYLAYEKHFLNGTTETELLQHQQDTQSFLRDLLRKIQTEEKIFDTEHQTFGELYQHFEAGYFFKSLWFIPVQLSFSSTLLRKILPAKNVYFDKHNFIAHSSSYLPIADTVFFFGHDSETIELYVLDVISDYACLFLNNHGNTESAEEELFLQMMSSKCLNASIVHYVQFTS